MIDFVKDFYHFIHASPTPWHACRELGSHFALQDFTPLDEKSPWELKNGESYFVQRGGSLIAFRMAEKKMTRASILGSHTDSPAIKLKPDGIFEKDGYLLSTTEIYGGPNLPSWFDRNLAIAGKVIGYNAPDEIEERLCYLDELTAIIPSLATHLKGEEKFNQQEHLIPLLALLPSQKDPKEFFKELIQKETHLKNLLSWDLFLVPSELPTISGELFSSYRIDNLAGAHASCIALLHSPPQEETLQIAVFWNHEEIGSRSSEGALSPFFSETLRRITLNSGLSEEEYYLLKNRSLLLSIDSAHALHPNYPLKHDPQHRPLLGKGIVLKQNASQRYHTDSKAIGKLLALTKENNFPIQFFSSRSDTHCGSTIGPLHASRTGIATIDLGIPQLAMHSARETMALSDQRQMCKLLKTFLTSFKDSP